MKRTNVFPILGVIMLSTAIVSCHVNDTNDQPVTTTASMDTSTVMVNSEPAMMDTSKMATQPATMDQGTAGMAKPNAAKKGMKGKVSVDEKPAAKSTAKMEADNTGVYANVEVIPSFPGGNKGLQKFFDDNLQYPAEASNDGVEGTVNVMFVVDETGKLSAPHVMGDKMGYGLETEALRVVNKMPTWNPGKLKGKNVKTQFTLPVRFVLY